MKAVLLDPERRKRGLAAYLEDEKRKDGEDPEKEARTFTNRIDEVEARGPPAKT